MRRGRRSVSLLSRLDRHCRSAPAHGGQLAADREDADDCRRDRDRQDLHQVEVVRLDVGERDHRGHGRRHGAAGQGDAGDHDGHGERPVREEAVDDGPTRTRHLHLALVQLRLAVDRREQVVVVAHGLRSTQEEQATRLLKQLFEYYQDNLEQLPNEYYMRIEKLNEAPYQVVCDYIAGMTDRFAVAKFKELMIPSAWSVY